MVRPPEACPVPPFRAKISRTTQTGYIDLVASAPALIPKSIQPLTCRGYESVRQGGVGSPERATLCKTLKSWEVERVHNQY